MLLPSTWRLAAVLSVPLLLLAAPVDAQNTRMGLHGGFNLDSEDAFIGINAQFGITVADHDAIGAVTAELYAFLDNASVTMVDLDALLPLGLFGIDLYGGGGLTLRVDDGSDTDFGLNLKLGTVFGDEYSSVRPFVEIGQTLGAGTDTLLRGGIFFALGGG